MRMRASAERRMIMVMRQAKATTGSKQMTTVSINLTHDELVWLLLQFRLPPLFGMDETYFGTEVNKEVADARVQSGYTSLTARGLLRPINNRLQIDTLLMGVAGAFRFAEAAFTLTVNPTPHNAPDTPTLTWRYYQSAALTVEQTLLMPNIYRFTAVADPAALLDLIVGRLPSPLPRATYSYPEAVQGVALAEAIAWAKGDPTRGIEPNLRNAYDILIRAEVDEQTAERILDMLKRHTSSASLAILRAKPTAPLRSRQTENAAAVERLTGKDSVIMLFAPDTILHVSTAPASESGTPFSTIQFMTAQQLYEDIGKRFSIVHERAPVTIAT